MNIALHDGPHAWSRTELAGAVQEARAWLQDAGCRVLATLLDNGAAFVVIDEAAAATGVVHIPLPPFFTPAQVQHALLSAGVDTLLTGPAAAWPSLPWQTLSLGGQALQVARLPARASVIPRGITKITYTSGSTGTPKGVCLRQAALERVADGVVQALGPLGITRHLSALPFAVLLENVAGQMSARRQGATLLAPPLAELGWQGSSHFDVATFHAAVLRLQPDSAFSYLRSHGTLDQEHTAHFALLMDRIDEPADQAAIAHAARAFYRLYGDVFRGLPMPQLVATAEEVVA